MSSIRSGHCAFCKRALSRKEGFRYKIKSLHADSMMATRSEHLEECEKNSYSEEFCSEECQIKFIERLEELDDKCREAEAINNQEGVFDAAISSILH